MIDIKLMHGDCLELMKEIPDGSIDMVLTDPPFGMTKCAWDSVIPFEPMWEHLHRITKKDGAIVLFGSEPFSSALRMSNIKNYKYDWVYLKTFKSGHLNAKKRPMVAHEMIHVFYLKQPYYNNIKSYRGLNPGKGASISKAEVYRELENQDKYRRPDYISKDSVLGGFKFLERGLHPTQKPVGLLEYLIKTYTNKGETVLDFTAGSGSTGVACVNTGRNFIGIELDEDYFKIAKERISNAE